MPWLDFFFNAENKISAPAPESFTPHYMDYGYKQEY